MIATPPTVTFSPRFGAWTLFKKEVLRFWKVAFQTVAAPILTALLYLLIFNHVLAESVQVYENVSYVSFLIPGLIMMSVLQNAFANTSSSLIQSKITGNIIFILLPPLSHWDFFWAYLGGALVRGVVVGAGIFIVTFSLYDLPLRYPLWIVVSLLLGGVLMGSLGIIAGLWAEKFDQIAAFQNFLIVPATFLSGVFYSIHSLPAFWQGISKFNPFFYLIDTFRYGFFGQSDVSPWLGLIVISCSSAILGGLALTLLRRGYKIRA